MDFLLLVVVMIDFTAAIECNFKFVEFDVNDTEPELDTSSITKPRLAAPIREPFECVQPKRSPVYSTQSRVNVVYKITDDDYESVSSCEFTEGAIRPKAMTDVHNQLTQLANTNEINQTIHIQRCLHEGRTCTEAFRASVCTQKYVRTTLLAVRDDRILYNHDFYYPSLCACEFVKRRRGDLLRPNLG